MSIADRLRLVNMLLEDTHDSIKNLESARIEDGYYPVAGYGVDMYDSKSNVIKRIDIVRGMLLKIKKELEKG